LIPYGVINRGVCNENHSVLIAVHNGKVYVIDPKNKSEYQITSVPHKSLVSGMQRWSDGTNCGRYTAYTLLQLINQYETPADFDLTTALAAIKRPNLSNLKNEYANLLSDINLLDSEKLVSYEQHLDATHQYDESRQIINLDER